jgi:hypothetical protein
MTNETQGIILTEGEDVRNEIYKNLMDGNLITKLTKENFNHMIIDNIKFIRIADPHETDHHNNKSIWVEATIRF